MFKLDPTTKLSKISQALLREIVTLGLCHFQKRDFLSSVTGDRSTTLACYGEVKKFYYEIN